jgi:tetratricopeptide (TPR) repeat protein
VNKSTINQCLDRLNDSLQTFQVRVMPTCSQSLSLNRPQMGRSIDDTNRLFEIQTGLQATFATTKTIAEELHEVHDWLLTSKNSHSAKGGLSLAAMPSPLAHMYGRDDVVEDIVCVIITHDKPRVVIHGAGGMGKTSVAVSVVENKAVATRYDANHRFWVPCIGAKSIAIFLDILLKSFRITQDTRDPLGDLISGLKASKVPRLILLDNFETAWSLPDDLTDGGHTSVEAILDRLAAIPHLAILITIRINNFPSDGIDWTPFYLQGIDRESAKALFTRICPTSRDHPALEPLLDALGHMPYAVTLLAKQSAKLRLGLSPDILLEEWQKLGPDSLSGELKSRMNRSIELSVESRSMSEDPNAQILLAILSQLPNGTTSKHLKWWASEVNNPYGAIATLSDAALITQHQEGDASIYSVLPVVQSYLNQRSRYNSPRTRSLVTAACCRFVLDHKSSPGDNDFISHQDALAAEQTNILSIFLAVTASSLSQPECPIEECLIFDAMLAFCWFQFWKKGSIELLRKFLGLFAPNGDPSRLRYSAEARFCLGKMYFEFDRYEEASMELEAARLSFRNSGTPTDIIRAGECALGLAKTWIFMYESDDRVAGIINEAQRDLKDDPKGAARALTSLGEHSWYMGRPSESLKHLQIAHATLQDLNCTVDVAQCLYVMSRCYAYQGALPEWERTIQASLEASRLVGMDDPIGLALRGLSCCYTQQGQYDKALDALREALGICEELGFPGSIADVLELSGYAYAKKRDFVGARLAYEEAKKVYAGMARMKLTEYHEVRCERNLRAILERDSDDIELDPPPSWSKGNIVAFGHLYCLDFPCNCTLRLQ